MKSLLIFMVMIAVTLGACSGQDKMAKGNALMAEQKFAEAEAVFQEMVQQDPDDAAALNALGNARFSQAKWDLCMTDLSKAIELAEKAGLPKDTIGSYYFDRGLANYIQGQYGSARTDFQAAVDGNYDLGESYAYLGVTVGNIGDDIKAIEYLNKAVKVDPTSHFAWSNRGYYNSKVGDNKTAIFDFSKAIELLPDDKVSYLNRGYTYIGMGDYESALKDIDRSLALDSTYLGAIAYKGIALTNTGQSVEGIRWLDKAIEMQPENPAFFYYRGVALINAGIIDRGCSDLATAAAGGHMDGEGMREQFCKGK